MWQLNDSKSTVCWTRRKLMFICFFTCIHLWQNTAPIQACIQHQEKNIRNSTQSYLYEIMCTWSVCPVRACIVPWTDPAEDLEVSSVTLGICTRRRTLCTSYTSSHYEQPTLHTCHVKYTKTFTQIRENIFNNTKPPDKDFTDYCCTRWG